MPVNTYLYIFEDWSMGVVKGEEIPEADLKEVDSGALEIIDITNSQEPKLCLGSNKGWKYMTSLVMGAGPGGETVPWAD